MKALIMITWDAGHDQVIEVLHLVVKNYIRDRVE